MGFIPFHCSAQLKWHGHYHRNPRGVDGSPQMLVRVNVRTLSAIGDSLIVHVTQNHCCTRIIHGTGALECCVNSVGKQHVKHISAYFHHCNEIVNTVL